MLCDKSVKITMCKLLIELKVRKRPTKPNHGMSNVIPWTPINILFDSQNIFFFCLTFWYLTSFRYLFCSFLLFGSFSIIWWFMILLLCDTVKVLHWFDTNLAIQRVRIHIMCANPYSIRILNIYHTFLFFIHSLFFALCLFWFLLHF